MSEEKERTIKPPSFLDALIPIIVLVAFLASAIILFGDEGTSGPIQVALIMNMLVAAFIGLKNGHRWADMGRAAVEGISTSMGAIFTPQAVGALVGGLMAVILQPDVVLASVNDPSLSTPVAMFKGVWSAMATGFSVESGYEGLDSLFSRGGMASMLDTVWLILIAMAFGGVMEHTGLLARLVKPVLDWATGDRRLLVATGWARRSMKRRSGAFLRPDGSQ